jgi:hypothetical protein
VGIDTPRATMAKHFQIHSPLIRRSLTSLIAITFLLLTRSPGGIFGTDDREFVRESSPEKIKLLSKSIAIQIPRSRVKNFDDLNAFTYTTTAPSYQAEWNTCDGTRFNELPSLSTCTAFLVGKDLLLTAAHCGLLNQAGCDNSLWAFDYKIDSREVKTKKTADPHTPFESEIPFQKTYRCRKILSARYDPERSGIDYALVQLDRAVDDRKPLKLKLDGKFSGHEMISSIGSLGGLPLQVTQPMPVKSISATYLSGPIDMIAKGSGGPFLNESGEVVGIVVLSSADFQYREIEGVREKCTREFILNPPFTDEIILPNGEKRPYPYSSALRLDALPADAITYLRRAQTQQ